LYIFSVYEYLKAKCLGKYLNQKGMKVVGHLGYYITRNFLIYTGHTVLLGQ